MTTKDDGGPAFPQTPAFNQNSGNINWPVEYGYGGMTIRDEFAKAAMQGLLAADTKFDFGADFMARMAYDQADAMLKARNQ